MLTANFKDYIRARAELAALKLGLKHEAIAASTESGTGEGFRLSKGEAKAEVDFSSKEEKAGLWLCSHGAEGELFSRYVFVEEKACFENSWKEMADYMAVFFRMSDFK